MPGPVLVSSDRKVDIDVLERARALIPVLAARSAATVANRRVPDETIADFHRAGLFRVLQPARFGGLELDFAVFATSGLSQSRARRHDRYLAQPPERGLGARRIRDRAAEDRGMRG